MHRSLRGSLTAVATAALALASLGATTQAASPLTAVFHGTQSHCVDGVSNHTLTSLNLYDGPTLEEIASTLHRNTTTGHFHACFATAFVDHDLTLTATSNFGDVNYTVPNLTVDIDRVTDKVSGHSHANHSVTVRVYDCVVRVGLGCPRVATRSVRASATGDYSADMTSAFDLRGTDQVSVTDTSSRGDTWLVNRSVPYLEAIQDFPQVNGVINAGQHTTLRIKSHPGGSTMGSGSATGDAYGNILVILSSAIHAGRQLLGDFASDARVTVPSTTTTFEIVHGDQLIHTRCLPNRPMVVTWQGTHLHGVLRTADSQGRVTINLSTAESDHFRLPDSEGVVTVCQTPAGDMVMSTAFPLHP